MSDEFKFDHKSFVMLPQQGRNIPKEPLGKNEPTTVEGVYFCPTGEVNLGEFVLDVGYVRCGNYECPSIYCEDDQTLEKLKLETGQLFHRDATKFLILFFLQLEALLLDCPMFAIVFALLGIYVARKVLVFYFKRLTKRSFREVLLTIKPQTPSNIELAKTISENISQFCYP